MIHFEKLIIPRFLRDWFSQRIQVNKRFNNFRVKKFFSYYKPYLGWLFADVFAAFVLSGITLLLPLCIRYITKNILQSDSPDALTQIFLVGCLMLVLLAIHMFCQMFVDYKGHSMGARMESDMRLELFDHYQKLSFGFYDEQKTGQLMSRITHDIFWLSELFHHGPEDFTISLVNFIGTCIILFSINLKLALITFIFFPFMLLFALYFNKKMDEALTRSKERVADINTQVEDTLSGIRVVQSFTNEAIEREKFAYENNRFVQSRFVAYKSEAYYDVGLTTITHLISIAVVIFGAVAILDRSLDLADLLTYLLYIGILIEPIRRIINFTFLYQEGFTGFKRFMEILEIEPDIQDSPNAIELKQIQGNIQFIDLSFKYKAGYDDVLKNISLDIEAGEYVALVGSSGIGKTTLCSLIPRFYEPNSGEILLDGKNIKDISLDSLRKNIGVVQQDVYLFAGTVAENIRYGKPDASEEEITDAAKKANAHDFIIALPYGYDTDIGQRGVKLSGGQKQRLSIARVFLKNPPILILDEATSSLDNESEKSVRESLEQLSNNRTTLVIAHRLSTIRNAQRIVVLTDKGIDEQGTHEELIALEGAYASLYNMQLKL